MRTMFLMLEIRNLREDEMVGLSEMATPMWEEGDDSMAGNEL